MIKMMKKKKKKVFKESLKSLKITIILFSPFSKVVNAFHKVSTLWIGFPVAL